MTRILECEKCYHLQETAPDAAYCAHMHVNPCYRGLHKEPKVTTPKMITGLCWLTTAAILSLSHLTNITK